MMHRAISEVERLEARRLLSSVELTRGVLRVVGDDAFDDFIHISLEGTNIVVTMNSDEPVSFRQAQVRAIRVHGLGGDDEISIGSPLRADVAVSGGEGNDTLIGSAGSEHLLGREGDDRIIGGGGRDLLNGGEGDDWITGGSDRDLIYGSTGNDLIDGEGGNDFIRGGAGDDTINGGAGSDLIFGEDGNDRLIGSAGNDALVGGPGNDFLDGREGNNLLFGAVGHNTLLGGSGNDRAFVSRLGQHVIDLGGGNNNVHRGEGPFFIRTIGELPRELGHLVRYVLELR